MAIELGLDLSAVILFAIATGLALLALVLVDWITTGVGWLPVIGGAAKSALTAALVNPLESIVSSSERRLTEGLSALLDSVAVLVAIPLLIGYGAYEGLRYLWHEALKPFVHAVLAPVLAVAHRALAIARAAEHDATRALSEVKGLPHVDVSKVLRAAENYTTAAVRSGVAEAEKYASTAVNAATDAPREAAALAGRLATAAETDASAAFDTALGWAEGIAVPIGNDVTALEQYVKGLGLAGLVAAVPGLAYLVQALVNEAGLSDAACREKNRGICGVDPLQWASFLEGLALLGFGFSLADLAAAAQPVVVGLEGIIKEAA